MGLGEDFVGGERDRAADEGRTGTGEGLGFLFVIL